MHVDAHFVDIGSMTVDPLSHMVNLLLVVLEDFLFGNDVGLEVRLQPIALKASSIRGSTARKDGAYLSLKSEVLRKHPHVHRGRVTHGLSCLVQSFVWSLPVQDPHLQQVE